MTNSKAGKDQEKIMAWLISSRKSKDEAENEYAHLGLTDNPFPIEAIVNRNSDDPRVNGSIFAPEIRQNVIFDFESRLLGRNNPAERYRLGYLWSQGDQALGRGVGKTAMLNYLQQQLNHNWGVNYFQSNFPACALYVHPEPGMNKLEYVAVLAMQELVMQQVLDSALANLRYQTIIENWSVEQAEVVRTLKSEEGQYLLDATWLNQHGFDMTDLNDGVTDLLVRAEVEESFAQAIAREGLLEYLKGMRRDHQLTFRPPPRDTLLYRKANHLFFTQSLRTLKAAGYQGAYLFIDDLENVIDRMGRREREAFAKELGYILLRGDYEAGTSRFLTIVLTTHAAAAQRLSEAWSLAGLQASLPMSLDAPNSILLPVLNMVESRAVIRCHLENYRLNKLEGSLHPFTLEAAELLIQHSNYHPREFLSKAHFILEQARPVTELSEIDTDFVVMCLEDTARMKAELNENIDVSLL